MQIPVPDSQFPIAAERGTTSTRRSSSKDRNALLHNRRSRPYRSNLNQSVPLHSHRNATVPELRSSPSVSHREKVPPRVDGNVDEIERHCESKATPALAPGRLAP